MRVNNTVAKEKKENILKKLGKNKIKKLIDKLWQQGALHGHEIQTVMELMHVLHTAIGSSQKKQTIKGDKIMKNDIKKLYKKDPKLAIQVAKALGYKIKAKSMATVNKTIKKGLDKLAKDQENLLTTIDNIDDAVKEKVNGLIPKDVDAAGRAILNSLASFRKSVKKYLDWKVEDKK